MRRPCANGGRCANDEGEPGAGVVQHRRGRGAGVGLAWDRLVRGAGVGAVGVRGGASAM